MTKLRLQITAIYEANPEWYDTEDFKKMADIDESNFNEDPNSLIEFLSNNNFQVKVDSPHNGYVK